MKEYKTSNRNNRKGSIVYLNYQEFKTKNNQ